MKLTLKNGCGIIGNVKIQCEEARVRIIYDNGKTLRVDDYSHEQIKYTYSRNEGNEFTIETDDKPLIDTIGVIRENKKHRRERLRNLNIETFITIDDGIIFVKNICNEYDLMHEFKILHGELLKLPEFQEFSKNKLIEKVQKIINDSNN